MLWALWDRSDELLLSNSLPSGLKEVTWPCKFKDQIFITPLHVFFSSFKHMQYLHTYSRPDWGIGADWRSARPDFLRLTHGHPRWEADERLSSLPGARLIHFRSPLSGIKGQGTPKVRWENNPLLLVKLEVDEGLFDGPLSWQISMVFLSRASDWVSEEYKFSPRRSVIHYLSVFKRTL